MDPVRNRVDAVLALQSMIMDPQTFVPARFESIAETFPEIFREPLFGTCKGLFKLPFHEAIVFETPLPILERIYNVYPEAVREHNNIHHSALSLACIHNKSIDHAKFIISRFPEARTYENENTGRLPLHCLRFSSVVKNSLVDFLDLLVDGHEETLLHRQKNGETLFERFVLDKTLVPMFGDVIRQKMLSYARTLWETGATEAFRTLLKTCCVDSNMMTLFLDTWPGFADLDLGHGLRPLHLVCSPRTDVNPPFLEVLIADRVKTVRKVADATTGGMSVRENRLQKTPLHYLAQSPVVRWRSKAIPLLETCLRLNQNEDVLSLRDARGRTPFHAAVLRSSHSAKWLSLESVYWLLRNSPMVLTRPCLPQMGLSDKRPRDEDEDEDDGEDAKRKGNPSTQSDAKMRDSDKEEPGFQSP